MASINRLNELKNARKNSLSSQSQSGSQRRGSQGHIAIEMSKRDNSLENVELKQFYADIDIVTNNIKTIRNTTRKIQDINQEMILATNSNTETDLQSNIASSIKATNQKALLTKKLLQALKKSYEKFKSTSSDVKVQSADYRIRENAVSAAATKFIEVMNEYQNVQLKYKADIKSKTKRQIQIVKPDATAEEIDAVYKSGISAGDVVKSSILKGESSEAIRNAYSKAASKYQDVLALEASVEELHQMFLDFAILVDTQGELLNNIKTRVDNAADYIVDANINLEGAISLLKNTRKWQCICVLLIFIIIAIIVGVVLATQATKNGGSL